MSEEHTSDDIHIAAYEISSAIDGAFVTDGPDYNGNVADALFRIGTNLGRIADSIEGLANAVLIAHGK